MIPVFIQNLKINYTEYCFLYVSGVSPVITLNCRMKYETLSYPQMKQILSTDRSSSANNRQA